MKVNLQLFQGSLQAIEHTFKVTSYGVHCALVPLMSIVLPAQIFRAPWLGKSRP